MLVNLVFKFNLSNQKSTSMLVNLVCKSNLDSKISISMVDNQTFTFSPEYKSMLVDSMT